MARVRQAISQLLKELSVEDSAADMKAKPARKLTLWTDKTELAVVAVAIARAVIPVEAGVVKRSLSSLRVRLQSSLLRVRLLMVPPLRRRRELLARDVSALRPLPLKKRKKLGTLSTTTSQTSKLNLRVCSVLPLR
jgi:hypothetical protein